MGSSMNMHWVDAILKALSRFARTSSFFHHFNAKITVSQASGDASGLQCVCAVGCCFMVQNQTLIHRGVSSVSGNPLEQGN